MLKLVSITAVLTVVGLALLVWWWIVQPVPFARRSQSSTGAYQPRSSAASLRETVEALSTKLVPRNGDNPERLAAVAAYIRARLEHLGLSTTEQPFVINGQRYMNVVTRVGPRSQEPVVIVGAHYDVAGPYPGADDNASGVAGLIELARLLAAEPLAHPVELVAYSLEEPPYFATEQMGSVVHARSLGDRKREIRAMIALEMIGYFDDTEGSQQYPLHELSLIYPTKGNFIGVVGTPADTALVRLVKGAMLEATPLPVESINAPRLVEGIDFSDHRSYLDLQIPAIMVTDTAMFRNPHYHAPTDTAETLDYQRMAMVVDGVAAAVTRLAELQPERHK